ncbi:unnamed protein product [Wuchereria bancrofti]|uniref:Uncharacterized protein n=1 Tax=Wuchereria bancrofti TaxID=6293 RepID=A0A3P7DSU5_WUCBA|nr:unnamed protein product [Wuchereria bancrofti]
MPLYFCHIVSLAMIDRETTERYQETQEQALKLIDLFKVPRSFCALNSSAHVVLLRLLLLPLLTLLICFCSDPFLTSDKWWSPQNKAALLVIYSTLFSIVSIFFTIFNESIIHGQSEQDITDGVYSKILSVLSFLFASAPNDLLAFTSSILIISFCAPPGDCIFDNTEMINNKPMEQFCRWTNGTIGE